MCSLLFAINILMRLTQWCHDRVRRKYFPEQPAPALVALDDLNLTQTQN